MRSGQCQDETPTFLWVTMSCALKERFLIITAVSRCYSDILAWSSAAQPVVSEEASALGGGLAPYLTIQFSSPAFFCAPNIWIAITPKQRLVRKDFGTRGFWHIISSFVLPRGWDPLISWLIRSQPPCCWGRDAKLFCHHPFQIHCWNVPLITGKNFPFLLAVAQCSLVSWVVLLTGIEAFKLELFLHFLVSGDSFGNNPVLLCFRYLGKAVGMACSLSPVFLHSEVLVLPLFLKLPETHCKMGGGHWKVLNVPLLPCWTLMWVAEYMYSWPSDSICCICFHFVFLAKNLHSQVYSLSIGRQKSCCGHTPSVTNMLSEICFRSRTQEEK